jgi:hypothetical protein
MTLPFKRQQSAPATALRESKKADDKPVHVVCMRETCG